MNNLVRRQELVIYENLEGASAETPSPALASSPPPPPRSSSTNPNNNHSSNSRNDSESDINDQRSRYYVEKILKLRDFDEAFELVKMAVEKRFKMHRAGLALALQGLPGSLGAYHVLGSNMIILNKRILNLIKSIKTTEQYNSFLFTVLAHEYLHSFGIADEFRVRNMTHEVCRSLLGEDHPATIMARYEPWSVFPELGLLQNSFDNKFELIKEFDRKGQSYIS